MSITYKSQIHITTPKFVVLGSGNAFEKINKKLKLLDNMDFFIESSPTAREVLNKKVISINEFLTKQYSVNEYSILICTSMWEDIKKNIDWEAISKYPIINVYSLMLPYTIDLYQYFNRIKGFIKKFEPICFSNVESAQETNRVLIMIQEWAGSVIP